MPPPHRSRKSPGAQPLTSKREQYLALVRQGMRNAGASRVAGVNRKTGHRWRYGRVVTTRTGESRTYAAITGPAHPVSARYLSEAERISIADGLIRGSSIRAIAGELGRAPSTISREIRRNRDAGSVAYHPYRAGHRAARRRSADDPGSSPTIPSSSTADPARSSAGRPLPSSSIDSSRQVHDRSCCDDRQNPPDHKARTWGQFR